MLLTLSIFLFTALASAEPSFYIPQSQDYEIKVACDLNGANCPSTTRCNITSYYPNSSFFINNKGMGNLNNGFFNYSLNNNQTSTKGEYGSSVSCVDSTVGINDTSVFTFEINPTGIRPTEQRSQSISRGVYFMFILGILLFIGFLFTRESIPVRWTFFIFSLIFFLIGINIIFISISDEIVNPRLETFFDGFTAITWYSYWFAGGLLALIWALTFINTILYKKNMENIKRFGLDG